jgi:hypothetical protein
MKASARVLLTLLAASAFAASLAASATARNFSVSNRNIRVVWTAARPLEFISNIAPIRCEVTLEGTLHCATIAKVAEALIGFITRARVREETCEDNELGTEILAEIVQESLPWHLRYVSFSGTLPRVRVRVRVINAVFRLIRVPIIVNCLYRVNIDGLIGGPAGNNIDEGNATLRPDESLEFNSETFGCFRARLRSAPISITLLGTTTGIRVRLT